MGEYTLIRNFCQAYQFVSQWQISFKLIRETDVYNIRSLNILSYERVCVVYESGVFFKLLKNDDRNQILGTELYILATLGL